MSSGTPSVRPLGDAAGQKPKMNIKSVWPEVWKLVRPRRGKLAFGLGLVLIRSLSGLALPFSPIILIDKIVTPRKPELLPKLVLLLLAATAV